MKIVTEWLGFIFNAIIQNKKFSVIIVKYEKICKVKFEEMENSTITH